MRKLIWIHLGLILSAALLLEAQGIGGKAGIGGTGGIGGGVTAGLTVISVGKASSSGTSPWTVTLASGIAAGHCAVVVSVQATATANTLSALTDTASPSNTYNLSDTTVQDATNAFNIVMSSAAITHAISAGGHITLTSSSAFWYTYVFDVSSCPSTNWLDQAASHDNSGNFTASWQTGTTSATTNATDAVLAVYLGGTGPTVVTWTAGYSSNVIYANDTSFTAFWAAWITTSSTGTQSATSTLSGNSGNYAGVGAIGAYK